MRHRAIHHATRAVTPAEVPIGWSEAVLKAIGYALQHGEGPEATGFGNDGRGGGQSDLDGPEARGQLYRKPVTGNIVPLKIDRGTYVFEVEYEGGEKGVIALDFGAGMSAWPESMLREAPLLPKDPRLKMSAASESMIENLGTKVIRFKATPSGFSGRRQLPEKGGGQRCKTAA